MGRLRANDCNGNTLSDGERTFAWDADNKPVSIARTGVGTTTFAYSGDGARVKKVGPAKTIRYAGGLEDHVTDGAQVKHIGVGGLRIATKVVGGINAGVYYTHGDHLGSLNVLTNSTGTEVQRLTYLPYGETHTNQGSVDFHQRRYTGQEQDPETGLYFYHARYYNPAPGRFLSADAIVPNPGDPQSLNRYSYVDNDPVNRVDPSGHSWLSSLWKKFRRWADRHPGTATGIGIVIHVSGVEGPVGLPIGDLFLSQTSTGRYIIAAEVIVATAVATFYCGGCGAWAAGALVGEIIGGVAGAYSAYRAGGDISQGLLFGVVVGGATGALAGGIGAGATDILVNFVAGSICGAGIGAAGGYAGGRGSLESILTSALIGAAIAGIADAAHAYYQQTVGYGPDPRPGEITADGGYYDPTPVYNAPPQGVAAGGANIRATTEAGFWGNFIKQGGFLGRVLNPIPTFNAFAVLHDTWANTYSWPSISFESQGTWLPALVVTDAALLGGPPSSLLIGGMSGTR